MEREARLPPLPPRLRLLPRLRPLPRNREAFPALLLEETPTEAGEATLVEVEGRRMSQGTPDLPAVMALPRALRLLEVSMASESVSQGNVATTWPVRLTTCSTAQEEPPRPRCPHQGTQGEPTHQECDLGRPHRRSCATKS